MFELDAKKTPLFSPFKQSEIQSSNLEKGIWESYPKKYYYMGICKYVCCAFDSAD